MIGFLITASVIIGIVELAKKHKFLTNIIATVAVIGAIAYVALGVNPAYMLQFSPADMGSRTAEVLMVLILFYLIKGAAWLSTKSIDRITKQ